MRVQASSAPRRPTGFTIATVNDDWATPKRSNFSWVRADVMMGQETKFARLGKLLNPERFGVHQNLRRPDQAGSAIAWKKGGPLRAGERGYALAVRPQGAKMLSRWINYTDFKVDGRNLRVISVHRPPARFKRLWPDFDRHLAAFVKQTKGPVIVGLDANERNPRRLAHLTGLRWHAPKGSIDGFLSSRDVRFDSMKRLRPGSSDHHPVLAHVHLRPR